MDIKSVGGAGWGGDESCSYKTSGSRFQVCLTVRSSFSVTWCNSSFFFAVFVTCSAEERVGKGRRVSAGFVRPAFFCMCVGY